MQHRKKWFQKLLPVCIQRGSTRQPFFWGMLSFKFSFGWSLWMFFIWREPERELEVRCKLMDPFLELCNGETVPLDYKEQTFSFLNLQYQTFFVLFRGIWLSAWRKGCHWSYSCFLVMIREDWTSSVLQLHILWFFFSSVKLYRHLTLV